MGHSYYDYVKNYSGYYMNKYQSNMHWFSGRGSQFGELLRLKAVRMKSNRNWMWFDMRFGMKFLTILYLPQFFFVTVSYLLSPAWRKHDERYNLRYCDAEEDDQDPNEMWATYQVRKKPTTRRKYADQVKIVYGGEEDYEFVPDQPQRYR